MHLIRKWNEFMGPKDERLEAEEGKAVKASAYILLAGSLLTLWYAVSLNQVAYTTDSPLLTPLGESVVAVQWPLLATIFAAGMAGGLIQIRSGVVSARTRYAEVDRIPWDFVSVVAFLCGVAVGVLACVMRILAEVQIVGVENVSCLGDVAMGVVFFGMAFVLAFIFMALSLHGAIARRKELEQQMED